jgi:DNA repair protein RadB
MNDLKVTCDSIDNLLGGGLERNIITKIFGEAGTGKTNFCLQISRNFVKMGGKVAYIDTECVSLVRLKQICSKNYNYNKILENILFFRPKSFDEQEKMISDVIQLDNVKLIVIDTINMFYRINIENDSEGSMRSLSRQVANLQVAARNKDLIVVLTEQVYTDKKGEIKPFTNRDTEHMAKTILKLEKIGIGKRKATIMKHRFQPEGANASFEISETGLI